MNEDKFYTKEVFNTKQLFEELENSKYKGYWAFRGQTYNSDLVTSFERSCKHSEFHKKNDYAQIEDSMIREFKRVYDGDDKKLVNEDTLYCLSLMRHYGAPTRLLDFTYSIYVATYFALECALLNSTDQEKTIDKRKCTVWCVNVNWLNQERERIISDSKDEVGNLLFTQRRDVDKNRNDTTFLPLFMNNKYKYISPENPMTLHKRLHLQQGVFLCLGDITESFIDNLKALDGWIKETSIIKINCEMDLSDIKDALEKCRRMNISRESLFPGLDGFAQAMQYHLQFYRDLYDYRQLPKEKNH